MVGVGRLYLKKDVLVVGTKFSIVLCSRLDIAFINERDILVKDLLGVEWLYLY